MGSIRLDGVEGLPVVSRDPSRPRSPAFGLDLLFDIRQITASRDLGPKPLLLSQQQRARRLVIVTLKPCLLRLSLVSLSEVWSEHIHHLGLFVAPVARGAAKCSRLAK